MTIVRTQIHLTYEQRQRLDSIAASEGRPLTVLVREAIERYLAETPEPDPAIAETFGSLPDLELVPRSDWGRPQDVTGPGNG